MPKKKKKAKLLDREYRIKIQNFVLFILACLCAGAMLTLVYGATVAWGLMGILIIWVFFRISETEAWKKFKEESNGRVNIIYSRFDKLIIFLKILAWLPLILIVGSLAIFLLALADIMDNVNYKKQERRLKNEKGKNSY